MTDQIHRRKVHMLKHCRVDGKPVKPGDIVETSHHRAKALTDTGYAKEHKPELAKPPKPTDPPAPPAAAPATEDLAPADPEPSAE